MHQKDNALCAIIVAAGRGLRSGHPINKVLEPIAGIPVFIRSLRTFAQIVGMSYLVVVVSKEDETTVRELLSEWQFAIPVLVCHGGHDRQASVKSGLDAIQAAGISEEAIVLIHDAARPFVSAETIYRCIDGVKRVGAACVGVPVKDTIKVVEDGLISETPDRSLLWQVQTPQAFTVSLAAHAHAAAACDGYRGTDDAMLVERLAHSVAMVMGDYCNIKMTTPEDWAVAALLAEQQDKGFGNSINSNR